MPVCPRAPRVFPLFPFIAFRRRCDCLHLGCSITAAPSSSVRASGKRSTVTSARMSAGCPRAASIYRPLASKGAPPPPLLDGWMDGWIRVREKVNCSQSRERDRAFDERLRCLSFSLSLAEGGGELTFRAVAAAAFNGSRFKTDLSANLF